jgi:hypothetical protein
MEDVIRGCGVVSVGVVWFGFSLLAWVFGELSVWGCRDLRGVSWWLSGRLFDVSRVAIIAK